MRQEEDFVDDYFISNTPIEALHLSLKERRALTLHLLYVLEMHDYQITIEDIRYYYHIDFNIIIEKEDELLKTVQNIIDKRDELDEIIKNHLYHWTIDRLSILVRLILRYAFFEFLYTKHDAKLIINEAVELAKGYAETDSYKFINGILDNFCKKNKKTI